MGEMEEMGMDGMDGMDGMAILLIKKGKTRLIFAKNNF